jgi:aryl-alcohol dehydrogenase-like predicted oxidoreductase
VTGGTSDDDTAAEVLDARTDAGITLLDTADVYGDGRSEERIRKALVARSDRPFVATKAGRRADPFEAAQYTPENLRAWVDRSRRNLGVDTLDLVQLHCPPPAVYTDHRVYDALDGLVADGAIAAYGVSVETVAEGLTALEHPGVQSIQVILNVFRRKPLEELLPAAAKAQVGVLARVPLASGLLTGKYDETTTFAPDDHRNIQPHRRGLRTRRELLSGPGCLRRSASQRPASVAEIAAPPRPRRSRCAGYRPAGVTTVFPGARTVEQVHGSTSWRPGCPRLHRRPALDTFERVYDERIAPTSTTAGTTPLH